jgi:hypothetical protein
MSSPTASNGSASTASSTAQSQYQDRLIGAYTPAHIILAPKQNKTEPNNQPTSLLPPSQPSHTAVPKLPDHLRPPRYIHPILPTPSFPIPTNSISLRWPHRMVLHRDCGPSNRSRALLVRRAVRQQRSRRRRGTCAAVFRTVADACGAAAGAFAAVAAEALWGY